MPDRQLQKDRETPVRHLLVFTGAADMHVLVAGSPVVRKPNRKPFRPLGDEEKLQVGPLFHHAPRFRPPFVRGRVEEVGGKAGVDIFPVRLKLVVPVPVSPDRQIKATGLMDNGGVPAEFRVAPVDIAARAAAAYLRTAVP